MADVDMVGGGAAPELSTSDVQQRFRDAAVIANQVLGEVLAQLAPGRDIAEICAFGDARIEEAVSKVYNKKKGVEKGIAFPTCVSVNNTVGHFSPLKSESKTLADGDVVKVDLGVHVDGFSALVAHTVVLGASAAAPVRGPAADVIAAGHQAAEVVLRMIKPGVTNTSVTEALEKLAASYGVTAVAGVQSADIKQFTLEGDKAIPLKRDPETKYEEVKFELNEAYAIDVAFSTGEGKPRESEARTTVYRRQPEVAYQLKMKASRSLITEVNRRFPVLPFTLRACGDEKDVKLAVTEAAKHGVLVGYPVVSERVGAVTSHFRFTALVLPNGTLKLTGLDLPEYVQTEKTLPADLAEIRASAPFVKKEKAAKKMEM